MDSLAGQRTRERISATNIIFPVLWGVVTGVLWAYANPIALVPGVIQWRIFAFLPAVIGIVFGPISGFASGYLGTLVWSLLAGTFIPLHTLLVDGIAVGFTGAVPGLLVGRGMTLREKATETRALLESGLWCLVTGVGMVFAVAGSLALLDVFPFWWAVTYLGLSDIVPLVVGTPLLLRLIIPPIADAPWLPPRF